MPAATPDPAVLPAVRAQIDQAQEKLVIACGLLRLAGWPENADELMRSVRHVQVWTMPDGWLDALARPDTKDRPHAAE